MLLVVLHWDCEGSDKMQDYSVIPRIATYFDWMRWNDYRRERIHHCHGQ